MHDAEVIFLFLFLNTELTILIIIAITERNLASICPVRIIRFSVKKVPAYISLLASILLSVYTYFVQDEAFNLARERAVGPDIMSCLSE